ncbi:MAG TPA: ABC transporter ATP-binding protein [Acidimicrobiales bacterium]|jgi:ATP-binding cassette subfamily B protein|nr:ABC transporter ATP-binding protein [Acidimicrobiales bacterium]
MLLRLLRSHLHRYRYQLAGVLLFQTAQALATLYLPSLTADIIDKGVLGGDRGYIWSTGGYMLFITFIQVACATIAVYYGSRAAVGFGRDVRAGLFQQVLSYSSHEVSELGAPSLITRVTNDVQQVQTFIQLSCTMLVAAPITCVGGIIMAVREDAGLSWILVVAIPLLVVLIGLVISRMVPLYQRVQDLIDWVNRVLREQLVGLRVVRAFVREPLEVYRFAEANGELTDVSLRAGQIQAYMFPIVMVIMNFSSIAVIWFGAGRINSGTLKVGALIAFQTYLVQILGAVMMATFMAVLIPRAAVCAERIEEVLDLDSSVAPPPEPIPMTTTRGTVELRGATFGYPGAEEPVLSQVDLLARPAQTTAIIGSTGAGKTTLLNLIPRLFDVTSGAVLVNGTDVRELDPENLWHHIGLVPQRPYLFSGTVASNLRFSAPGATDEELWEALRVAQAADFVAAMPGGLGATIAQGGLNVSGGQRQRLAIARALVRKPDIYLFDDSFSALDTATDARLRAALVPYVSDSTVIIVAQRVSTIRNADQILVLDDGHAVGLGTHHELLDTCPTYAEIVDSQMSAEEAA